MYHTIVKGLVKKTFDQFNRGDFLSVQKMMADRLEVHQMFQQDHALGGNRHNKHAAAQWYARLGKIFPQIHFAVSDIRVKGWPWYTVITAHWQDTLTLADNKIVQNQGWHRIIMRWFRITGVEMMTNENIAAAAITHQAQHGISETKLPPITDTP